MRQSRKGKVPPPGSREKILQQNCWSLWEVRWGYHVTCHSRRAQSLRRQEAAESLLMPTHGWIPSRIPRGVPVSQKECGWQETLRPLKRALNGNVRARGNSNSRKCTRQTRVAQIWVPKKGGSRFSENQGKVNLANPPGPEEGEETENELERWAQRPRRRSRALMEGCQEGVCT